MSFDPSVFAARRERLLERIDPGVLVIPAAPVAMRNNDVEHDYRQASDFYYFTGWDEPDSVLVLTSCHDEHRFVLFVPPRDPERETWDGARGGVEGAKERFGADAAFPIDELKAQLPQYLSNVERLHYHLGADAAFDRTMMEILRRVRAKARGGVIAPRELVDPVKSVHEMRLHKGPEEVEAMAAASRITREAHLAAMRAARPGRYEYEVEAEILRVFRAHGSERPAYGSIVGSGVNATVLHHRRNDRQMQEGDLLLIDAGCEQGYYASDVTRTFPVSGRFSAEQRAVYEIVLRAQYAALEATRPGLTLDDVHDAALKVIAEGLRELGVVQGSLDEVLEDKRYKPYFMHRTSHWLGMDVHDVGDYHVAGKPRPLEPGFALTVEPGLYFGPATEAAERWKGIGVRIEDDVVVTVDGHRNLTDVPKAIDDVEAFLAAR